MHLGTPTTDTRKSWSRGVNKHGGGVNDLPHTPKYANELTGMQIM